MKNYITKLDLIKHLQSLKISGIEKIEISKLTNETFKFMRDELIKRNRIEIRGFGSLNVHLMKARKTHNPINGEFSMSVPYYRVRFKMGNKIRAKLKELQWPYKEKTLLDICMKHRLYEKTNLKDL